MSYIVKNSDADNVSVQLTNNGVAIDLSDPVQFPYDGVEMYLIDRYGRELAKYKTPTTTDFHDLDIVTGAATGNIIFDIFRADSVNFTLGALYAEVVGVDSEREGFANGFREIVDKIYLGETIKNKI